jgi:hypothetical protein
LSISGASAKLTISNTTASTSSSTGALRVAGGAYFGADSLFAGNVTMNGSLNVGTVGTSDNRINFSGLTGDAGTNHTVIAERIYEASSEKSELLLFKGNDTEAFTAGPDRIRMRAAEFRFQTYTTAEDYSGMSDNNNRLIISNSGNISISSTTASTSSSTGALQVAGGAYFGAASLFAGNLTSNGQIITTRQGQGFSHNDGTVNLVSFVNNSLLPGNAYFGTFTNHSLILQTNNSSRITISNTGATTVSSTLGVTGATTLSSNLTLNGTSATLSLSGASSVITLSNTTASTSSSTGALQVAGGAYFGANSIFNNTLRVMGQESPIAGEGLEFGYTSNNNTANMYSFDRTGGSYKNINFNDKMYIKGADGTVGIGTNSPAYSLDFGSTAKNMILSLWGGFYGIGACNTNLQSFSDGGFTWHTVSEAVTGTGAAPGTRLMNLNSSGQLGIGITSPTYPLHVASTGASYNGGFAFYSFNGSSTSTGVASNPSGVMIYSSDRVMGSQFNAFSDSRIKKNILDVDDLSALNTLRLIQPKKYNYIDTRNKTTEPVWGFIAQQVRSVLEHSTTLIKDFIPNIFQLAIKSINENNEYILTEIGRASCRERV